uniref:Probable Xaa-Pro aminopeptidase P n=2 Tax=Nicotiana TaxID=4085 RepID=A0A1S4APQ6_TOBAC|nr:PREDICTED: probable Xaa-Pro aminopeptidase P [Nicotiana sylvestris]XP_016478535.1 PREDICTED: probable Xaa-Pro aminopeptidase P [Nicotiana tabacum]
MVFFPVIFITTNLYVGVGANGAIIHYKPEPDSCSIVDGKELFLLDSGGQYIDGTTDITRTVHFGEPSARERECFTRVLQGHIALDQAVFPENTPGFVLDAFARSSLWKVGLDYRHGTGHGVGAALNVHEGPHSISFRFGNMTPLLRGMIVSNEPGYYEDHQFGIRIENLLYVKEVDTPNRFGGIGYLGFEKLTFAPIQTKLVDLSLLSVAEVEWLNSYHSQVWEKVSPLLDGSARQWLWNNTRPLTKL